MKKNQVLWVAGAVVISGGLVWVKMRSPEPSAEPPDVPVVDPDTGLGPGEALSGEETAAALTNEDGGAVRGEVLVTAPGAEDRDTAPVRGGRSMEATPESPAPGDVAKPAPPDEDLSRAGGIRRTFSTFLEVGRSGDAALAEQITASPGMARQLAEGLPQMLPLEPLGIYGMAAGERAAWVVTTPIAADHGREGFLTITLELRDGAWLINDVDVEKPDQVMGEWSRFLERNPDAEALIEPDDAAGRGDGE